MPTNYSINFYPEEPGALFFLEFSKYGDGHEHYTLFKRNTMPVPEGYHPFSKDGQIEMHPYNLLSGDVAPDHLTCFNTKTYLRFVVDAMNEKAERENHE